MQAGRMDTDFSKNLLQFKNDLAYTISKEYYTIVRKYNLLLNAINYNRSTKTQI